eukprot:tig00020710_g13233.t1
MFSSSSSCSSRPLPIPSHHQGAELGPRVQLSAARVPDVVSHVHIAHPLRREHVGDDRSLELSLVVLLKPAQPANVRACPFRVAPVRPYPLLEFPRATAELREFRLFDLLPICQHVLPVNGCASSRGSAPGVAAAATSSAACSSASASGLSCPGRSTPRRGGAMEHCACTGRHGASTASLSPAPPLESLFLRVGVRALWHRHPVLQQIHRAVAPPQIRLRTRPLPTSPSGPRQGARPWLTRALLPAASGSLFCSVPLGAPMYRSCQGRGRDAEDGSWDAPPRAREFPRASSLEMGAFRNSVGSRGTPSFSCSARTRWAVRLRLYPRGSRLRNSSSRRRGSRGS